MYNNIKQRQSAPKKCLVSQTCSFSDFLDDVELGSNVKIQKISITGPRDMGKIFKNVPQMDASPIFDPQDFFKIGL